MARRLFTVTDRFLIQGRGLVLVPGILPVEDERFRAGDPLMLKRPDGLEIMTTIGGIDFLRPNPNHVVPVMLKDLGKDDVAVGTEVWSVD